MPNTNTNLLKLALRALRYSRADNMAAPLTNGMGVIFMLHHVAPDTGRAFEPNRILRVRPQFLEQVIEEVCASGFDVISLDEVPERVQRGPGGRPFACFTFDDGYRDNRDYAYPILKSRNLPFAVYVPSAFAEGDGDLWWLALEGAISNAQHVSVQMEGELQRLQTRTTEEKYAAYNTIYWWLRTIPEHRARAVVRDLAQSAGYDGHALCSKLVMSWNELREFAKDPLVTIGAHTVGHYALSKLSIEDATAEMKNSIIAIEHELGRPCHHFSYPYGGETAAGPREFNLARDLGMKTAVTTRKGLIHNTDKNAITALPRLSLNGDFQDIDFVKTLLSGVPFAMLKAVKRIGGPRASV